MNEQTLAFLKEIAAHDGIADMSNDEKHDLLRSIIDKAASFTQRPEGFEAFVDYCLSFYGTDGIYANDFDDGPMTREEIETGADIHITGCNNDEIEDYTWGDGDSIDRERVRYIVEGNRAGNPTRFTIF